MYTNIVRILKTHKFVGISFNVEVAKGFYETPETLKDFIKQVKRIPYGKRKHKL